jgi:hypothetical protein
MKTLTLALFATGVFLASAPVDAHHSFAATYLADETITIEGELVQILFRNPHSFVHVAVKDKNGAVVRYAVEWRGAAELETQGVHRDTLKPGDRVVISGNPGRNSADHRLRANSFYHPKDGLRWKLAPGAVN